MIPSPTKYLTENSNQNVYVLKEAKVSGCLEHVAMIWEAIQTAASRTFNVTVIFLYLLNTNGSVPNQLILQLMLDDYFSEFKMRFSTERYTRDWIKWKLALLWVVCVGHRSSLQGSRGRYESMHSQK
ncbi:reverse transcriptase [Plakobranchus ocellatus]|uniref:Reverse transcriptase n=1 Tax=Plakobranchus ocellatus TaxID=259542 RepID=A0AAV4B5C7_9GAST|nr:reverse transcriptase [Plakobranchus ocellatus]